MDKQEMKEYISEGNDTMLFANGFDEALIGVVTIAGPQGAYDTALYDRGRCIRILIERDGMTEEDAEEYFEFNIANSYVGEGTPAYATILAKGDNWG
ncbi:hypothetical protein BSP36_203 [Bacillus phage BSP36]|uniref:Uncharacterized protein n=1 Tax=Bacillus phage BSP38 TaxID=2283013 RepID=A0A345MK66_BPBSP|nr:hypothetical protein HWB82_gp112 [Bacillus phage BSP38]AXH71248.1 hypothetical protein BSP38_206 [Bacillus phage BSP38]AYJ75290.1 hypothetical protein BSP36_203 [Bacillus phage BSP36]